MKKSSTLFFGNLFEHYETALFGFLSPFLAPLIFPQQDPVSALIYTYAIIPLGMLSRPLGALFFGYMGDAYGKEWSLSYTLYSMAIVSLCMALIPIQGAMGFMAPLLFLLGRALQNFFAAGETMGGAILLLDSAPKNRSDFLSSLYSSSAICGHLLASFGVYVISVWGSIETGWKALYLLGTITAFFGSAVRGEFKKQNNTTGEKLFSTLISNWKIILKVMFVSGFATATYSLAFVLMNGLIPLVSSLTKTDVMKMNTALLLFDACSFPFFGWLASKFSRDKWMLCLTCLAILIGFPLFISLEGASKVTVLSVRLVLVGLGVAFFAPFHAWAQEVVPQKNRYLVISFGYALGSQLLGSPAAAFSLWMYQQTGLTASLCLYWLLLAIACSIFIYRGSNAHQSGPFLNRNRVIV